MKENEEERTEVNVEKSKGMKMIKPLKDFRIKFNEFDIEIKKGVEVKVPEMFLSNLKIEKVIN